jgi:hypothetical protein
MTEDIHPSLIVALFVKACRAHVGSDDVRHALVS